MNHAGRSRTTAPALSTLISGAALLAALAPAVTAVLYINAYGINGAQWDHLTNAELFERYYTGQLTIEYLFRPHLEHIKLFPRLVCLVLGLVTRFNNVAEMYFQAVLLGITCVVLYAVAIRRALFDGRTRPLLLFAPVTLLIFSLRHHQSLLVGDGMITYLCVAAAVATLSLIAVSRSAGAVGGAAAAAFVASFSHANGLLLWPIGVLALLLDVSRDPGRRRIRRTHALTIWLGAALVTIGIYVLRWPVTATPALDRASTDLSRVALFALAAAGAPFGQSLFLQYAFGAAALVIQAAVVVAAFRHRKPIPFGVWLMLFAMGCQMLIALGRAPEGLRIGVASRYAAFLGLGMTGAYLAALELARRRGTLAARLLAAAALAVLLTGSVFGYRDGLRNGPQERDARLLAAHILRTTPAQTDATLATLLYPNPQHARAYSGSLQQRGLNVFADRLPDPDALPRSGRVMAGLDRVNLQRARMGVPVGVSAGESVYLAGWAFDPSNQMPFEHGFARLRDGIVLPLAYGMNRPELKRSLGLKRPHVGFEAYFSADMLAEGENRIRLTFVARDPDRSVTTDEFAVLVKR